MIPPRPTISVTVMALFLFPLALALTGCSSDEEAPAPTCPTGAFDADAARLFDAPEVARFDITLHGTSWSRLMAKAREEEYTSVAACYNGKSIGKIGLRFKGQVGSLSRCFEGDELLCKKLSMRLKFDFEDEDRRFFGLKHLNLHSLTGDPSHLRERLAYELYRAMDVDAPRSDWAELIVDGKPQGLYSMVEQVDGRFIAARWPDASQGNVYKEAWPTTTDAEYFRGHLETHEETAQPTSLLAFARELAEAAPVESLGVLSRFMDKDQLSRYMVVDDATLNWDGITALYADEDGSVRNHNFFIFEKPSGASGPPLQLIPWDMDHTFEVPNWRSGAPYWREPAATCPQVVLGCLVAGCDPILRALASDADAYRTAAHALLQGPFAEGALEGRISDYSARIEAAVGRDGLGPTLSEWRDDVASIRSSLPRLREYVRRRSDGPPIERLTIPSEGVANLSQFDELETLFGMVALAATGARASFTQPPADSTLAGLRLNFDLPKTTDGWAVYFLPLAAPNHDLKGKTGVRFRARGSGVKYAALNVDGAEGDVGTTRWSWPLSFDDEAALYELRLADLIWPDSLVAGPTKDRVLTHVQDFVLVVGSAGVDASGFIDLAEFEIF